MYNIGGILMTFKQLFEYVREIGRKNRELEARVSELEKILKSADRVPTPAQLNPSNYCQNTDNPDYNPRLDFKKQSDR